MTLPLRLTEADWVCFLHISKTGGLTFLPLLDRMFPPEQRLDHHNVKLLDPATLGGYRLVRSHGTYDELRSVRPEPPVWLTFLREPVARALSTYKYMARTEGHEAAELIQGRSFDEFVFGPPELTVYIADYQTRILTSNLDPAQPADVSLALERLREFAFVGLTERYEASLDLLCYSLCWPPFPSVERKNTTPDPLQASDLNPRTLERLREINQADARVYELWRAAVPGAVDGHDGGPALAERSAGRAQRRAGPRQGDLPPAGPARRTREGGA